MSPCERRNRIQTKQTDSTLVKEEDLSEIQQNIIYVHYMETPFMVKPSLSLRTWIIESLVDEILVWLSVRSSFTWTLIFLKWGSRGSTNSQFAPSEIAQDLLGTRISKNMLSRFCYPFCRYFSSSKVDIFLLQMWHKWRVQRCVRHLYLFIVDLSSATLECLSMWWCLHRSRAG